MLSLTDIYVGTPQYLAVHLQRKKTDQFGAGTTIYLGQTKEALCPVTSVLAYLAMRQPTHGPLFIFQDGTPLSCGHFVTAMRQALQVAGCNMLQYSGPSFRIGAATTAAQVGLSDSLIKTLGQWRSTAYITYIQTPKELITIPSMLNNS